MAMHHDRIGGRDAIELRWRAVRAGAVGSIDLVIRLERHGDEHGILDARREDHRGAVVLRSGVPVRCATHHQDGLHIDVFEGEQRLLALSLAAEGRLRFARTSLIAETGLSAAAFDPPVACAVAASEERRRA